LLAKHAGALTKNSNISAMVLAFMLPFQQGKRLSGRCGELYATLPTAVQIGRRRAGLSVHSPRLDVSYGPEHTLTSAVPPVPSLVFAAEMPHRQQKLQACLWPRGVCV